MKTLLRKILGVALLILGILGLFLPFLQGILFIVLGLSLLGFPRAKNLLRKFKNKDSNQTTRPINTY